MQETKATTEREYQELPPEAEQESLSNEELRGLITTQLIVSFNLYKALREIYDQAASEQSGASAGVKSAVDEIKEVVDVFTRTKEKKSGNVWGVINFCLLIVVVGIIVFFR